MHCLYGAAGLVERTVVGQRVPPELDLDRRRRDRDHGHADERLRRAGERLEVDRRDEPVADPHRLAALLDRARIVLPWPLHAANRLAHMSATLIKGKPIAERIRAQVAEDVAAIGHIGLVTVLVGDDPASDVYIRLKHKAAVEAGIDATDLRLPEETSEADLLAKVEELDARPRGRRHPGAAAVAEADRRGEGDPRARACKGR